MKFNELLERKDEIKNYEDKLKKIIKIECLNYFKCDIDEIDITRFYNNNSLTIIFQNQMVIMYNSENNIVGGKWSFNSNNTLSQSQLDKVREMIKSLDKIVNGEIEF